MAFLADELLLVFVRSIAKIRKRETGTEPLSRKYEGLQIRQIDA
jgi:hypothetical protein